MVSCRIARQPPEEVQAASASVAASIGQAAAWASPRLRRAQRIIKGMQDKAKEYRLSRRRRSIYTSAAAAAAFMTEMGLLYRVNVEEEKDKD